MESTITKRLHISGLTPSISQQDLHQRLSTFGNVKSLDGLGAIDAVGRPKKFAYVTLEGTPAKLSKCVNSLSGSTWKGAKLRVGDAKLDFRERVKAENEKHAQAEFEALQKKRRWRYAPYRATHAKDMSPITLDKAKLKGGWVVTPLGRVYRPLRMRPPRPLSRPKPSMSSSIVKVDLDGKGKEVEKKGLRRKRIKNPDLRARRRKIDMVKYGSQYLKGRFLDADVPFGLQGSEPLKMKPIELIEESGGEESDDLVGGERDNREKNSVGKEQDEDEDEDQLSQTNIAVNSQPSLPLTVAQPKVQPLTTTPAPMQTIDLHQEKNQSLNILASLFGPSADDDEDDDWIGRESLDSDVEDGDLAQALTQVQISQSTTDDFEVVPRDGGQGKRQQRTNVAETTGADVEMEDIRSEEREQEKSTRDQLSSNAQKKASTTSAKLKDLFAPVETEGGFSLLGHLDLDGDLELDGEVPFPTAQEVNDSTVETQAAAEQTSMPATSAASDSRQPRQVSQITLDPSQPLVFPLALLATHPAAAHSPIFTNPNARNRPKDMYDTLKEKGWDWVSSGFYRTQTEDEIRQRWEEQKGELTQSWKKRWREAAKLGRRRGKGGGGEEV